MRRVLRLIAVGLAAGLVAAFAALLWSRLLMWGLAAIAPDRHGDVTHENAVVGQRTLAGTLNLLSNAPFFAIPGAVGYLAVRRWLPGRPLLKGLGFGAFILVLFGDSVLDGNYEYYRYASPAVSVSMFATVFLVFGVVVAPLTERWAGPSPWGQRGWATVTGRIALGGLFVIGAGHFEEVLSGVYDLL